MKEFNLVIKEEVVARCYIHNEIDSEDLERAIKLFKQACYDTEIVYHRVVVQYCGKIPVYISAIKDIFRVE